MSARLTATFDDESFEVEISSDGELAFVDYDIEYDIAFAAMGGNKTPAVRLLDEWRNNPIDVICDYLGLDKNALRSLGADWAEHVLPIFEKACPKDKRPRKAIKAARDFVAGKITADQLEKAHVAAWTAVRAARMRSEAETAEAAEVWAARAAAEATGERAGWPTTLTAVRARDAAADRDKERAWQVCRFVRVMERIQAGKKWPPLGAKR